jgi:hypothetical protein
VLAVFGRTWLCRFHLVCCWQCKIVRNFRFHRYLRYGAVLLDRFETGVVERQAAPDKTLATFRLLGTDMAALVGNPFQKELFCFFVLFVVLGIFCRHPVGDVFTVRGGG